MKPAMIGVAAVLTLMILGGGAWFSSDPGQEDAVAAIVQSPAAAPAAAPVPSQFKPAAKPPAKSDPVQLPGRRVAGVAVKDTVIPTTHLWTRTWANVREGRGTGSPVVVVLEPGVSIGVADRESHWWAVIEGGIRIGYVANSVLTSDPAEAAGAPTLMSRGN